MRLVVTRPLEDANILAARLTELGHVVFVEPMLTIEPVPAADMPRGPWQAILLTSSHAARLLKPHGELHHVPVLAVGERTAEVARETGFSAVEAAEGDAISLAALVRERLQPEGGRLLYVTGRDIARDMQAELRERGFRVERHIIYKAETSQSLSSEMRERLRRGEVDGVILLSPRTAATWRRLVAEAGLGEQLAGLVHYCLSEAVAAALQRDHPGSLRTVVALQPSMASMMEAIDRT